MSAVNSIIRRQSFLMIGSLEVTHELLFTIPSVTEISSISSIRLRFNLGKPRLSLTSRVTQPLCIV